MIRADIGRRPPQTHSTAANPPERIPTDLDIDPLDADAFRPYLGKKFSAVLDELRTVVRTAVAHLDPFGDSLVADEFEDITKCEILLPVVKYIARQMITRILTLDPTMTTVAVHGLPQSSAQKNPSPKDNYDGDTPTSR